MGRVYSTLKDENGQGMVEYGLIVGLIAVLAIAGLTLFGYKVQGMYNYISLHNSLSK